MLLEVKDLNISLTSEKSVAEHISFRLGQGEMLSIVGSSGAGKRVRDLRLPPACMIAALMKDDGSARVPGAQDIVNAGDRLIIILNRDIARQVADIFM